MKKIKILIVLLSFVAIITKVNALGEVDAFPPEITKITIDDNTVNSGEKLIINFETADDISGTDYIDVTWCHKDGGYMDCEYENLLEYKFESNGNNNFTAEYTIPNNLKPGEWIANYVNIVDKQYNNTGYNTTSEKIDISSLDFIVSNDNYVEDTESPVLNEIKVLSANYQAPGELKLELDITDNQSTEFDVIFNYDESPLGETSISQNRFGFDYTSENKKAFLQIEKYKKYYLWSIEITDDFGNKSHYTYDIEQAKKAFGNEHTYKLLEENYDLIASNYVKDTTPPVFKSFKHNKKEVTVPSVLFTDYDIKDEEGYIDYSNMCFKNDEGTFDECFSLSGFETVVELTEGKEYGKSIYLYKVELTDNSGNVGTYTLDNGDFKKEEIIVKKENKSYDLTTICSGETYLQEINKLENGKTVLCKLDEKNMIAEKELFDAIKGKDITVTFTHPEGYEWIINGKDIVNETKDINLEIKLSLTFRYYLPEYEFPNIEGCNGIDDGDEFFACFNKLKEKPISDYFDYLKELGYPNTDVIKKKALKSIYELGDADFYAILFHATGSKYQLSINFRQNGLLPGEMTVRVKPDLNTLMDFNNFENLYLYHVVKENDFHNYNKKGEKIKINSDDYYEFKVSHNSEYRLTDEIIDQNKSNNDIEVPQTIDNIFYAFAGFIVSLLTMMYILKLKK